MTAIREQLHNLIPSDSEEATHQAAILALLNSAADPFDRNLYAPGHITASGFVVSRDSGRTLLIFHRKLNRWLQPGGHVEAVDSGDAEVAARREVFEETGLAELPSGELFDLDVHLIPARAPEPAHFHHDLRYLFVVGEASERLNGELEACWFSADEVLALELDAGTRRMITKARGRGLLR